MSEAVECKKCRGTGKIHRDPCATCGGSGRVRVEVGPDGKKVVVPA